jgi:hypothetical protein
MCQIVSSVTIFAKNEEGMVSKGKLRKPDLEQPVGLGYGLNILVDNLTTEVQELREKIKRPETQIKIWEKISIKHSKIRI